MEENEKFEFTFKNIIKTIFDFVLFYVVLYALMFIATL